MDTIELRASEADCNAPLHYLGPERCSENSLIELSGVVKTFKNAAGEFTALKGITTCFNSGEFVSIVGKSGSGKSTLANMLTGIDHPTKGTVRVGDTMIHKLSENAMSLWRGRNLGIVFQFFQLMPTMTLLENVMLPMALANLYKPREREQRSLDLLKMVGLETFADKLPAAVSGGQQQSAAIARALANDPPIVIADEPTGNLDSRSAEEVFDIFEELVSQGKTILMVTHDISLAARTTRTLLLADGELIHPCVAEALPDLPHSAMLWLTHQLKSERLAPGAALDGHTGLAVVQGGGLMVERPGQNGHGPERLGPGSFLSVFDLKAGAVAHALDDGSTCLLWLDAPAVWSWLEHTPQARHILEAIR